MSREAFDVEAALERCHKGTAWQRELIRAQLIDARAAALDEAAEIADSHATCEGIGQCIAAEIRALKEKE